MNEYQTPSFTKNSDDQISLNRTISDLKEKAKAACFDDLEKSFDKQMKRPEFPWVATESSEGWFVRTGSTPITPIDWLAEENAHKIAAVPDLLEALQELFELANHYQSSGVFFTDNKDNSDALNKAEAAIAKALNQ